MPISLQDIYEPPWLRSDPSGQGLMQGIALGQAVLEGQARRQQMQQAAERFPVMMEGLRLQNEATREGLPLELEQMRLGNQLKQQAQALNTVQLQNMTEAQKLQAQREASMGELARTMSTISGQGLWGTDTADTFISGLGVRAPWLIASPEWKALSGMQEDAKKERAKVEADKARADLQREIWGVRTESAENVARIRAEGSARLNAHPNALTLPGRMLLKEYEQEASAMQYGASYVQRLQELNKKYEDRLNQITPGSNPTSNRIKVIAPDGKPGTIPEEQLGQALKQGFRRAE